MGIKKGKEGHWLWFKQPDFSSMIKNKRVMFTPLSYPDMAEARILLDRFQAGLHIPHAGPKGELNNMRSLKIMEELLNPDK